MASDQLGLDGEILNHKNGYIWPVYLAKINLALESLRACWSWRNLLVVLTLLTAFIAGGGSSHAKPKCSFSLSDRLPKFWVKSLLALNISLLQFDEIHKAPEVCAQAKELLYFWKSLKNPKIRIEQVVDSFFSLNAPNLNPTSLEIVYPLKVHFIRLALIDPKYVKFKKRIEKIKQKWLLRYFLKTLSFIGTSQMPIFQSLAGSFAKKIEAGSQKSSVVIDDLSPALRVKISNSKHISLHHSEKISEKDSYNNYSVTGYFNSQSTILSRSHRSIAQSNGQSKVSFKKSKKSKKTDEASYVELFALDMARPIGETIIATAHELIHAEDPYLEKYATAFKDGKKKLLPLIQKKLGHSDWSKILGPSILDHILFQSGIHLLMPTEMIFDSPNNRIKTLRVQQSKIADFTGEELRLEAADKKAVEEFMTAVVGLSLENEYRAYGYSAALYAEFAHFREIIPHQKYMDTFIGRILSGDRVLSSSIYMVMKDKAFSSIRNSLALQMSQLKAELLTHPKNDASEERERFLQIAYNVQSLVNQFEIIYADKVNLFLSSTKQMSHFKDLVERAIPKVVKTKNQQNRSIYEREGWSQPDYVRPGQYYSPTNPHTILYLSRLTTAWVLSFKRGIETVYQSFYNSNRHLSILALGILDTYEVSHSLQPLMGLSYDDSPYTRLSCVNGLEARQLPFATNYFVRKKWSFTGSGRDLETTGTVAMQNLIAMHSANILYWLNRGLPKFSKTMTGIITYLKKLESGKLQDTELSDQRAQLLKLDLEASNVSGGDVRQEVDRTKVLIDQLYHTYKWAASLEYDKMDNPSNWERHVAELVQRLDRFTEILESYRLYSQPSYAEQQQTVKAAKMWLYKDLSSIIEDCSDSEPILRHSFKKQVLHVTVFNEPLEDLVSLCYQRNIYLLRPPCGNTEFLTPQIMYDSTTGTTVPYVYLVEGGAKVGLTKTFDKKDQEE